MISDPIWQQESGSLFSAMAKRIIEKIVSLSIRTVATEIVLNECLHSKFYRFYHNKINFEISF
jgi:hypothetical protein